MQEIKETLSDMWMYVYKTVIYVKPLWVLFTTAFSYVLFPDASFIPAGITLVCAIVLDVVTKYYAISVNNGGLYKAIKTKKITSDSLWVGMRKKLVGILIIMILCGLSYRISPFTAISTVFQSICFTFFFLRESQSVVENMIDAGHEDLKWVLFFIKKKKKELLEENGIEKDDESSNSAD